MQRSVINLLLQKGDDRPAERHKFHLLAVRCLETSGELSSDLQRLVKERLSSLIPPQNMQNAKELAAAGELVVPFLAKLKPSSLYAAQAAACIRTLRLIGTRAALEALPNYFNDSRSTVLSEIGRHFSDADFKADPLSIQGALQRLREGYDLPHEMRKNLHDLEPLRGLSRLHGLNLSNCPSTDFSVLRCFTDLRALNLTNTSFNDLEVLQKCQELVYLRLEQCPIRSLLPLNGLTTLGHLDLDDTQLQSLESVGKFPNLKNLLFANTKVASLEPLAELEKLMVLRASKCPLRSLDGLAGLNSLTRIDLASMQDSRRSGDWAIAASELGRSGDRTNPQPWYVRVSRENPDIACLVSQSPKC